MTHGARDFPWWGVFVLVFGVWWLLGELGVAPFSWKYVGPLAVIVAGLAMVTGAWTRRQSVAERQP